MSDTTGPTDPNDPTGATGAAPGNGPDGDPFRQLRLPVTPLAPRPAFAAELRRRIEHELAPPPTAAARAAEADQAVRRTPTHEERTMSTTASSGTDTADPTATAAAAAGRKPPLSPYLAVPRAAEAIDWYRDVLGAIETTRFTGDDGRVGHCELVISGSTIMLADEFPEMGVQGPGAYGGTPVMLHLEVVDVDYTFQRAVDAGAEAQRPPADQGHGNRNATIVDPFGHRWMLSQPLPAGQAAGADTTATDPSASTVSTTDDGGSSGGDVSRSEAEQSEMTDASGTWTVTGRTPVEPGYLTINPGDPRRAREFFGALFAWQVGHANPDGSGHVDNTRFPIGIAPPQYGAGAGHAPTTVYFRVDDPAVYARRVEELGGRVLERNDYSSGSSISCEDDQGYRFELWQPAPGY